jgi:hypothetical protein
VWADDGCEHITDAGIKPEFQAEAAEIEKAQWLADNQFAADIVEEERLAAEYWNSLDANGRKK